jgi:chemotaxis protein CheD
MSERDTLRAPFQLTERTAHTARRAVYLHPGELLATKAPSAVKTILGSCISVCLWDAEREVGGINHYLLPSGVRVSDGPGRFGSTAIPLLLEAMHRQGARLASVQAKLFGGSSMVVGSTPRPTQIGLQNLRIATELLDRAGIPVISSDVGGARGRKIVFNTDDGSVSVWEL